MPDVDREQLERIVTVQADRLARARDSIVGLRARLRECRAARVAAEDDLAEAQRLLREGELQLVAYREGLLTWADALGLRAMVEGWLEQTREAVKRGD